MARGGPTLRLLTLHRALQRAPEGRRAAELADELGVSTRTVHRMLGSLEEFQLPLDVDEDGPERRWRLDPKGSQLPVPGFSAPEALAVLLAEQLVRPSLGGTVLGEPLRSAAEKIRAALDRGGGERLLRQAGRQLALPGPHHDYRQRDPEIASLRRAIAERRTVQLRYRSRGRPLALRALDPYALVVHAGALYVVGRCHKRRAARTFLVDRIRAIHVTTRAFTPDPAFRLDRFFQGAFGVFRGRPQRIRLRFAPAVADLAAERIWHESQRLTRKLDGSAELSLQVAETPDLVSTLLAFGRHVRVLAPKSLAESMAREWFAAASESAKALREKGREARPNLSRPSATVSGSRSRGRARGRREERGR